MTSDTNHNSSGQWQGSPLEVTAFCWHWGAFFWNWLWCFAHGLPLWGLLIIGLTVIRTALNFAARAAATSETAGQDVTLTMSSFLVSIILLGVCVFLGARGHQMAWENRRYTDGVPEFVTTERIWSNWGLGIGITSLAAAVLLLAILLPQAVRQRAARAQQMQMSQEAVPPPRQTLPPQQSPGIYYAPAPVVIQRQYAPQRAGSSFNPPNVTYRLGPNGPVPNIPNPNDPRLYGRQNNGSFEQRPNIPPPGADGSSRPQNPNGSMPEPTTSGNAPGNSDPPPNAPPFAPPPAQSTTDPAPAPPSGTEPASNPPLPTSRPY